MERVTIATFILLALICCSAADYGFELELYSYDNPSGLCRCVLHPAAETPTSCYDFVCCDNFNQEIDCTSESKFPDVYFIVCLRVFEETPPTNDTLNDTLSLCTSDRVSSPRDRSRLSVGERVVTHHTIGTTTDIHFDDGYSELLGAPNPLPWIGRGAFPNEGLELIIEVWDYDSADWPDFNDLVDRFVLRVANHSVVSCDTFTGQYNITTVNARLQAVCTNDSYGSDCGILCVERDNDQGHYTCDSEGNRVCRPCYQNPETNCTDLVCSSTTSLLSSPTPMFTSTVQEKLVPLTPTHAPWSSPSEFTSSISGMRIITTSRERPPTRTKHLALIPLVAVFVVGLLAVVVVPFILVRRWQKRKEKNKYLSAAAAYYEPVKYDVNAETVSFRTPATTVQQIDSQGLPTVNVSSTDNTNTNIRKNKLLRFAVSPVFIEERGNSPAQQECEDDIDEPVDF